MLKQQNLPRYQYILSTIGYKQKQCLICYKVYHKINKESLPLDQLKILIQNIDIFNIISHLNNMSIKHTVITVYIIYIDLINAKDISYLFSQNIYQKQLFIKKTEIQYLFKIQYIYIQSKWRSAARYLMRSIYLGIIVMQYLLFMCVCQQAEKKSQIIQVIINGDQISNNLSKQEQSIPKSPPANQKKSNKKQKGQKEVQKNNQDSQKSEDEQNKIRINLGKVNDTDTISLAIADIVQQHTGSNNLAQKIADVVTQVSTLAHTDVQNDKKQAKSQASKTKKTQDSRNTERFKYSKQNDKKFKQNRKYTFSPIMNTRKSTGPTKAQQNNEQNKQSDQNDNMDQFEQQDQQHQNSEEYQEQQEDDNTGNDQGDSYFEDEDYADSSDFYDPAQDGQNDQQAQYENDEYNDMEEEGEDQKIDGDDETDIDQYGQQQCVEIRKSYKSVNYVQSIGSRNSQNKNQKRDSSTVSMASSYTMSEYQLDKSLGLKKNQGSKIVTQIEQ